MRVVIDLITVRSGGGQQQALQLLESLSLQPESVRDDWLILVGRGTNLEHWVSQQENTFHFCTYKSDYFHLFFIDTFRLRRAIRLWNADVVYHFAPAWRGIQIPQVVRTVYSNLYFPEVHFWEKKPVIRYIRKRIVDHLRLWGTLRADGLIFENEAMRSRAIRLFGYPAERTRYIAPAQRTTRLQERRKRDRTDSFRVLYLSSWYRNKNIHIMPLVASVLNEMGIYIKIILSIDQDEPEVQRQLVAPIAQLNVREYFEFIGTVHPLDVGSVVMNSDCMILLSQLECFSSNILEAWAFERPLIISDKEWARTICRDAALYTDRDSHLAIAKTITSLLEDEQLRDRLIKNGLNQLSLLNTPEKKFQEQRSFLEEVIEANKTN